MAEREPLQKVLARPSNTAVAKHWGGWAKARAYRGRRASGGLCVLAGAPRICCAVVFGP